MKETNKIAFWIKRPLFHFPRQMFEGYSKVIFSCCEKKRAQQGHDTRMLGRFAFPRVDNHEVITVESDVLLPPNVAPSESCRNNSCHWIDTCSESC